MARAPVRVELEGGPEFVAALERANRDWRKGYRRSLTRIAEPTRLEAQQLALSDITRMSHSPEWAGMRTVVGHVAAYIAPAKRGTREAGRRRPNLATLLRDEALDPAERHHEAQVERDLERLTDKLIARLERAP